MEAVTLLVISVGLALVLALNAVFLPSSSMRRLGSTAAFLGVLAITFVAYTELLGRPRPDTWTFWHTQSAQSVVLYAGLKEGQAIYLYVQLPNEDKPLSIELPWNEEVANKLQEAINGNERDGGEIMMDFPFQRSWEDRLPPNIYNRPPPKPADKLEPDEPLEYRRI